MNMNKAYFVEDLGSSSEDEDIGHRYWTRDHPAQVDDSPPAMLAFSITSGRGKRGGQSPVPGTCQTDADVGEQGDISDGSVEEWMILDQESEDGDSTIQLNLTYSNISSSEEDSDSKDDENTLLQDSWTVSKRDKEPGEVLSICRYFVPGQSLVCSVCKKTGHRAKSCHMQRKYPVCVLCGIQGHLQKECPTRPCSRCGLLAHGARACDRPPVWHQHCQRCGIMGHLLDICPDTWRQFHHTIKMTEVPIRRWTYQTMKQKKRRARCYNCSKRGHYGHECHLKRMISGTFFTLPYVCHYDGTEKVHHSGSRTQSKNMEMTNKNLALPEQPQCFKSFEEDQKRNKMKQKAQASMRKTWPERRRERQEVKRMRREAQARREGGVLGQCRYDPDGDILDPFGVCHPWQQKKTFQKITKTVSRNRRNKKSKDTDSEQWKKREEKKHGLFYPHKKMNTSTENILSLKERVRHRSSSHSWT